MQNKSKKLTSRLLSALLALACVLTLLPGVAVAAETMTMLKKEEGSMVLEKGAVLEDDVHIPFSCPPTPLARLRWCHKRVVCLWILCWYWINQAPWLAQI